jgi:hypothetical protein
MEVRKYDGLRPEDVLARQGRSLLIRTAQNLRVEIAPQQNHVVHLTGAAHPIVGAISQNGFTAAVVTQGNEVVTWKLNDDSNRMEGGHVYQPSWRRQVTGIAGACAIGIYNGGQGVLIGTHDGELVTVECGRQQQEKYVWLKPSQIKSVHFVGGRTFHVLTCGGIHVVTV